jgi:hypothetical protein
VDKLIPSVIVIVIVALAIAVFLYTRRNGAGASDAGAGEMYRPRAPYREFHVSGESALVYFDVPLPAAEVDPVLTDLLLREATEVLRDKQAHHLPLQGVTEIKAFGTLNGEDVAVGSLPLESPGTLPSMDHPEIVPHFSSVPFDPLTHLGEKEHAPPSMTTPTEAVDVESAVGDSGTAVLQPLSEELALTSRVESGLRAQGLDPATMSAGDLALGLMRLAGYTIRPGDREKTYVVSTPGSRTFVRVVDHDTGDYPELDEREMKEFAVGFATAGTDRGILVTEKFGPYMIYDAERRNPKCKFITRERLQDFVDSFSMS